uniref:Uncharacterized protein n=1 Tax=Ananas comosus var. bracteatus TaxID=296719 RepID=A0A6V7NRQ7_ANACO|nr:unnamed protein product [Ananas comosus var. bracteatus]
MVNPKRLIEMVRKWQKVAALGRRRITSIENNGDTAPEASSTTIASKGHVFVYTADGNRFMVPLKYLRSDIFRELFKRSEEEFGLPTDGPIMLPCDAAFMAYIISLLRRRVSVDMEKAVLASIADYSHCTAVSAVLPKQQIIVYGF